MVSALCFPHGGKLVNLLVDEMAGPRQALWDAIIRKDYRCAHFIVERDHAGPAKDSTGKWFYRPHDAQGLFRRDAGELGVAMVLFRQMLYMPELACLRSLPSVVVVPEGGFLRCGCLNGRQQADFSCSGVCRWKGYCTSS